MDVNKLFEALSSPVRRKILAYLSKTDLTSSEIAARFDMSKPAISKHLSVLENASLVKSNKQAQYVHYSLQTDNLVTNLHDFLGNFCLVGRKLKMESQGIANYKKAKNNDKPQEKDE